ncbi:hypothetical protein ACLMJK_007849 [Lecanora helva]
MSTITSYLIFLNSTLSSPEQIQEIANLDAPPVPRIAEKVTKDYVPEDDHDDDDHEPASADETASPSTGEHDETEEQPDKQTCCQVSPSTLHALTTWAAEDPDRSLGMVISMAETNPASTINALGNYPVPYFLYGTLSDQHFLAGKLEMGEEEIEGLMMRRGRIRGWKVRRWGQYGALVNGGEEEFVEGMVYEVKREEEQDKMAK